MAQKLIDAGAVFDVPELQKELANASSRDIVAIGPDVLLPHFRTEAVDHLVVSLGIAPREVRVEDTDVAGRIVALVIAPPEAGTLYLQTVAALARFLEGRDVIRRLFDAVSADDVAQMPELGGLKIRPQLSVHDLMTHAATTVTPDMHAREAVEIMVRKKLRSLPVVGERGEVVGIVTEWDIMRALLPHIPSAGDAARDEEEEQTEEEEDRLVRDVMTRSVMCVSEEMGLQEAVNLMLNKKVEQCPVVKEGSFTGMLTRSDIIRKLFGR